MKAQGHTPNLENTIYVCKCALFYIFLVLLYILRDFNFYNVRSSNWFEFSQLVNGEKITLIKNTNCFDPCQDFLNLSITKFSNTERF